MAGPETFDALMKVVIIGDTAVGKTCMILRYTHDTFRENFLSTIGESDIASQQPASELAQANWV